MVRIARDKRHGLLKKRIEENPFINDEELAEEFSVSVATIRLDRMALNIPEMRIRIKQKAEAAQPKPGTIPVVGELVDCTLGHSAISIMTATADMVDEAHIVRAPVFVCSGRFTGPGRTSFTGLYYRCCQHQIQAARYSRR